MLMKIRILLIWLVSVSFLSSCSTKKPPDNYFIKEFKNEDVPLKRTLNGKKMNISGLIFPRRILNLKDHLIVSEHKTVDTLIHIIDKRNGQIVRSVGILGFGPGEIDMPWGLYPVGSDGKEFYALSLMQKKLDIFHIDTQSAYSTKTFEFNEIMPLGKDFLISSDSTIMSVLVDGNDKFVEFDFEGKVIQRYGTWDHMLDDRNLPESIISAIHQGMFNVQMSRNYYSLACIDVDRIELLNKEKQTITSIRGPIHHIPKFTVDHSSGFSKPFVDIKTIKYCYTNTVFGENQIYALFSGSSAYEVNKATNGKFNNDIYVFDLDGNIKEHYQLDYTIANLAVDEKERKFYGITFNEDPADIIVFDF